jgi:putative transposase
VNYSEDFLNTSNSLSIVCKISNSLLLEDFYDYVDISRQGFYQHLQRKEQQTSLSTLIIDFARDVRLRHPRLGARKIYVLMAKSDACQSWFFQVGRDKVETILLNNGFGVRQIKSYHRTTRRGAFVFKNLIKELIINGLVNRTNQVWVSDITYYIVVEQGKVKHYYLTFIMDLYSRMVLGYAAADTMCAEQTTILALEMALKKRKAIKKDQLKGLIFHSDGGGQYIDKLFLKRLDFFGVQSSMGKECYENPNAEKLNDIIKNHYLIPWDVNSLPQLVKRTPEAIFNYNNEKPHEALQLLCPVEFEKICAINQNQ